MTPSELAKRALDVGAKTVGEARTTALERLQRLKRRVVTARLPLGLPPLIEYEQYQEFVFMHKPMAMAGAGIALLISLCCCVGCICCYCNNLRKKRYRMYTPIEGEPFDECEETFLMKDERSSEGESPPRKARTFQF